MNNENIINKIKKLKALSDRGIGGEATNASKLLNELLIKYNLKYEEIFDVENKKVYSFSYSSKEEKTLLANCIANLFGSNSEIFKTLFRYKNGEMKFYLKLSNLEYALFSEFYNFHRNNWKEYLKKQTKLLLMSYIEAQKIYDISPEDENKKEKSSLSMTEIMAILSLAKQAEEDLPKFRKVIENK